MFVFTVPTGQVLTAIQLQSDNLILWAWIGNPGFGIQTGFTPIPANGDLLPQMGLTGLGAGSYGMYIESHDTAHAPITTHYSLNFHVPESVPTFALLAFGFVGVAAFRRRLN